MFSKISALLPKVLQKSSAFKYSTKRAPLSRSRYFLAFSAASLFTSYCFYSSNRFSPSKFISPIVQTESAKTLKVCVTGAAGQIGYAFIPLLLTGQVFGPNVRIDLRLLDIPQAEGILKGVIMEIEDGAYPLLERVSSGSDPKILFQDIDVGVFIGGFPRKPGMERKDLLQINGKIFKEQGEALNNVANPNVKCIVVANPANTNCLLLSTYASKINPKNFSALTRLDHNRAMAQIANKTGSHSNDVKNVIIWGNHSTTQYPDVNHGTVNGVPIRDAVKDDQYLNTAFVEKVQKRGGEVLEARKMSSVFSAANAAKDHLRDWHHGTKQGEWTSMAVVSDGSYNVPKGLVFSFPVVCHDFDYHIVQGLKIDEFSQNKFNLTTEELSQEKKDAL